MMPEFRTVARVADIPKGTAKAVPVGPKLIAIFHGEDGQFHAIDDVCPHMGASLAQGEVEENIVTCPWHGWRFDIADGTWVDTRRYKIGCYAVRVVGDEVQVEV